MSSALGSSPTSSYGSDIGWGDGALTTHAAYVATALAIDCDSIWSADSHLNRQESVACWTTKELMRELKRIGFRP